MTPELEERLLTLTAGVLVTVLLTSAIYLAERKWHKSQQLSKNGEMQSKNIPEGAERGRCLENEKCNLGLTCLSEVCVKVPSTSESTKAVDMYRLDTARDAW